MDARDGFLEGVRLRPLRMEKDRGLEPVGLALGQGRKPVEVAVTRGEGKPTKASVKRAWKDRLGGRVVPLLLVALYGDRAALCGPSGEEPPVYFDLDPGQVERICRTALQQPDHHAASRFLRSVVPQVESELPGLRNEGLFATHQLQRGVPHRGDWEKACREALDAQDSRGRELLEKLGFEIEQTSGPASILRTGGNRTALAVFLDRSESHDLPSSVYNDTSPVSYALAEADKENLRYVLVARGSSLRIYPTETGVGVGQRGSTETFAEVQLDLLPAERAGYLWLIFSGDALRAGGTFEEILEDSSDYAADLGARLRGRVYNYVVPDLAMAIADARNLEEPTAEELETTYEMALLALYRLLFIAYGEDQDLLPYRTNDFYRRRSLKQKAHELSEMRREGRGFDESSTHWKEFMSLCRAINGGKAEWNVPAYDGGLFSEDPDVSPLGDQLAEINLTNTEFGPILSHLLVDETPEGFGPVDFRSLGVREFGTIYEGLLESELSLAEVNLVVGEDGKYFPADEDEEPAVAAGEVYLHDASGKRKSTASYFTKRFGVDHLLDHSLEPALDEHLKRLDELDPREAAEEFFNFRVADISMGSGHFLVAAVDRIEQRFSAYLADRNLPEVKDELRRLRETAKGELGELYDESDIEDTQLLRRQIARRCIYGVDLNPTAVMLARLSLWIHTFVPGLPLSFLDRNIVEGNSLVGIGSIEEAGDLLGSGAGPLFRNMTDKLLGAAREPIEKLATLSDENQAQIAEARATYETARESMDPTERLFDILAASRLPEMDLDLDVQEVADLESEETARLHERAEEVLEELPPFHFPIAFPEVFLRDEPGFDVIVGNPPWEEAMLEEDDFWTRRVPGLQSRPQREQERIKEEWREERPDLVRKYEKELEEAELLRQALLHGPFPGMGTGDPDVYKAFCWRFWDLTRSPGGRIGVVLPRSAFCAKGTSDFREKVFRGASVNDLTFLLNRAGWVFEDAEHRYTIGLFSAVKEAAGESGEIRIRGPFADMNRYDAGLEQEPACFSTSEVLEWTDTAALPLLPAEDSPRVFARLRESPRLDLNEGDTWRVRPYRELDATNDKEHLTFADEKPDDYWPVFKGASFDIWVPDTGVYYAWAEPDEMQERLFQKRKRSARYSRSAFSEFPSQWIQDRSTLPCLGARIAFRDVARSTDSRTVRAALIPPNTFITNQGPTFLWPRGDERDEAFLLGVLCSIPLDWYARRFVETHLNYHVLNPFPMARPGRDDPLWKRTVELAGRLACPDERFADWADAVGVEYGQLDEADKTRRIYELDAVVAHLYGLTTEHLHHIFETFHQGWDYEARLAGVMEHFRAWRDKL